MKKQLIILSIMILIGLQFSCENEYEILYDDIPVVEAYLYTNQSLDSIKIVKALPYFSDADTNIGISGLNVFITANNESYSFKQSTQNPGYYIINDNQLIIKENTEYYISFDFNNKVVSSSTIGSAKPENFTISDTVIYIDDDSFDEVNNIEFTWNNPDEKYFMLSVQLTDTVNLSDRQIFDNTENPPYSILMPPMNSNKMQINGRMIQYFGNYRAVIFSVNYEYIELFESLNQNSSSLIESPSNIENGKGIFTAMSSDTLYFNVYEN